jgi:anti-sigma factor (TIGR02949 family)
MNRLQFGEGACEKIRQYLDSYISNELLVETNHEVLRHLEGCPACTAEVQALTRLRTRLKSAVKTQTVPPELQVRVRERIRGGAHSGFQGTWWASHWAVTMAASLLVCAAVWWSYSRERMPAISDRPAQRVYIQKVSASLAAVLKVGLGDHIHCAIFRKYPQDPPPVEQMETELGPAYQGLLPVVKAAVPDGYRVIMAHQCTYAGRKFVHLTMEKNGELLSLVIARKEPGETLEGLSPSGESSGATIYQSAAGRYQIAGFAAGDFLAYVVSDQRANANLQVAMNLAPAVRDFLSKVAA